MLCSIKNCKHFKKVEITSFDEFIALLLLYSGSEDEKIWFTSDIVYSMFLQDDVGFAVSEKVKSQLRLYMSVLMESEKSGRLLSISEFARSLMNGNGIHYYELVIALDSYTKRLLGADSVSEFIDRIDGTQSNDAYILYLKGICS